MNVIDLNPAFYCLYVKMGNGKDKRFLQSELIASSPRKRIDLFENEAVLYHWIAKEREIFALKENWTMHEIYGRLYAKKIFVKDFVKLMEEKDEVDSITFIDRNGIRRLYFRDDFENGFNTFPMAHQKLYPKEPIFIINRQRALDEKIILHKESYFITYPEIATPLFSVGIREWAEELVARKPNQGYYIEQTTLHDIYMRAKLTKKDPEFFVLSREDGPHYMLRIDDLKNIVEGLVEYC